jgi:DNA polymerase
MRLHIDIETRSRVDLRKSGVYRYVRCPDFRILMASWSLDGSPIRTALTYDEIWDIPGLWDPGVTKVAHNAAFERVCFSEVANRAFGEPHMGFYLPPEQYHDTMAVAAEYGYPQQLEKLAPALGAPPKDSVGTRLINIFCKPNRAGGWNDHTTHPMEWLDFIAYCEQDVDTLAHVDAALGDFPTETERAVYFADQRINDRGIAIDVPLAQEAFRIGQANTAAQKARVTELSGIVNPKSVQQVNAWLEEREWPLANLRAETVEAELLMSEVLPPDVREVLEIRQELALAAPAKFASALASHVDGRIRGSLRFFGAHTGRWSGRGTQPQNLPRLAFDNPIAESEAILTAMMGGTISSEELKKLVRPLFVGPFTVVDYRAIEAFVIAWLAGEEWVLEAGRDRTRDIYVETADRMGGLTRAQGKIAVLALGFGGGPGSLRVMAGSDDDIVLEGELAGKHRNIAPQNSIDRNAPVNMLIKLAPDDVLYQLFVNPWRDANPRIVGLWRHLEEALKSGGPAGEHLYVERDGSDRLLRLPSGRAICYRKVGFRRDTEGRRYLSFRDPRGMPSKTYGGRLAENATQAVARDLLAEALVRLETRGYPVAAHVHDEILVEGEHDVTAISKIMCELPGWAAGLPVDGEGFVCQRYRKG